MNAGIVLSFHGSIEAMLKKYSGEVKYIPEFFVIKKYAENFDKVFVFSHDSKRYQKILPKNVVHVRLFNRFVYLLFGWLFVLFYTVINGIRIIYVECGSSLLPVFLVNKITHAKVLLNYDNTWFMSASGLKKMIIKLAEKFMLKFVDYFVVSTSEIRNFVGKGNILNAIKKGIITENYNPYKIKKHPIFTNLKGKFVLFTGRLDAVKDPLTLIRSYKILKKKFPDIHLIIAGDGPVKKDCEKIADENVHFLGFVSDIPSLLKGSDIFVITSVYDASPKSLMEAMCMGLPSVATKVGGIPDILDDNCGFLVRPGHPEEVAEKIAYLLKNDTKAAEMGKNARSKILKYHDMEKNIEKEIKLLKGVLK